tara:strand:+ start:1452 stop:1892 length:441 start_codon:yes stop_codon:yes gene_type:complete
MKDIIERDIKELMKSGEKRKVEIVRFILSHLINEEKEKKRDLETSETIQILKRLLKRNQESFDQFNKAGRDDLASKEKEEIEVIQNYLPEEMSEEDIIKIISETIASSGATSIKEMGKVIGLIKKSHGDNVDMSLVSKHVKSLLNK